MSKPLFDMRLLGAKKLEKKLTKLGKRIGKKVIKEAAKKALAPVQKLAKSRAPIDTGRLQKSIKIAVYSAKRGDIFGAQVRTGTRKQLRIPPKAKYYYPAAIEYGTGSRAPRSFLRSAMGDMRRQVIGGFSGILKKVIERR